MKNGESIIDVRGMTKRFGELTAVDHVDLAVAAGEIYGFLGPNGSGKTTFLRMLCGLLTPDGGEGNCLGHDIHRDSAEIKKHVGYMTQRFSFYEDLSIEETLDFIARLDDIRQRRTGVEQVVPFGTTLHISGRDAAKLRASLHPWMNQGYQWEQKASGLEDVFISLMETAKDNFS